MRIESALWRPIGTRHDVVTNLRKALCREGDNGSLPELIVSCYNASSSDCQIEQCLAQRYPFRPLFSIDVLFLKITRCQ